MPSKMDINFKQKLGFEKYSRNRDSNGNPGPAAAGRSCSE